MKNTLLIFGYGYTAKMLTSLLDETNWRIFGTSRQPGRDNNSDKVKIVDFSKSAIDPIISEVTHILITTPPDTILGDPTLLEFKETILYGARSLQWIGYLSTTSVYGNHLGAWVDEMTPAKIETEKSRARYEAELYWLSLGRRIDVPTQIFRLAGIYGPKRNPLYQLIENKARVIYKEGQFFSRIHVEDIANVLIASMKIPTANEIFNLCDDLPSPTFETVEYAASLLQIPAPARIPFENAKLSEMALEFYGSNRRVKNFKIKDILSISLKYPTYLEGLRKMHEDGTF
jgi:nucleoside-diphosphate-sugar epimerase